MTNARATVGDDKVVAKATARERGPRRWRWPVIVAGPVLIAGVVGYLMLTGGRTEATDSPNSSP